MNKTLNVSFLLRTPWNYKAGPMPVFMRITVDGQRIEMNTNRHCDPDKWDSRTGRILGSKKEEIKQINNYLDLLQSKVFEAQGKLINSGKQITSEAIKNILLGKHEVKKTLLEVYKEHVKQVQALVGSEYALGTLKRYNAALSSLEAFLKFKKNEGLLIGDLKHQFITDYEFYLKSERKVDHNTAMGIIKKLKKIVRQCVANDLLEKDPFMNYKVKIREVERAFLSQEELDKIIQMQFKSDRLNQVRDIFIVSCYTGLSYIDMEKLTPDSIQL